jgi:orotate phosphoribosyltransferase
LVNHVPSDFLSLLSARQGHFRLESGHHGTLWLELETLFARQSRIRPFVFDLANKLSRYGIEAVCGPLVGGAFLAQTLASALDVEFTYAERVSSLTGSARRRIAPRAPAPGDAAPQAAVALGGALYAVRYRLPDGFVERVRGKRVAIVDDVINAGSAVRGACTALVACEAVPVAVGTLLVLGSAASEILAEHGLPLESVASLPNSIWAPEECPQCADGVPLEDLGDRIS